MKNIYGRNSKKKSKNEPKKIEFDAFKKIPKTIYTTPKITAAFILKEFE